MMTIGGWVSFILFSAIVVSFSALFFDVSETKRKKAVVVLIAIALVVALFCGFTWYFNCTADGQRQMVDQQSNLTNGLDRTITVYTSDGKVIREFTGRIDIEANDGGYVKFDFNGKRYTYYNCFIESIGNID